MLQRKESPWHGMDRETAPDDAADAALFNAYLEDLSACPRLSAAEERALGMTAAAGRRAQARLHAAVRIPPAARVRLRAACAAGVAAQQRLVEGNLRLVVYLVRRVAEEGAALADLIQDGNLGLMHAAAKFDPNRDSRFATYALWWIYQAVTRGARRQAPIRIPERRRDLAVRVVSLDRPVGADADSDPLQAWIPAPGDAGAECADVAESAARALLRAEVAAAIAASDLAPAERRLLALAYGLDDGAPRSLAAAGRMLQVSREQARRMHARALACLRAGRVASAFAAAVAPGACCVPGAAAGAPGACCVPGAVARCARPRPAHRHPRPAAHPPHHAQRRRPDRCAGAGRPPDRRPDALPERPPDHGPAGHR